MTLQSAARQLELVHELTAEPAHWLGVLQDQPGDGPLPPAVSAWLTNLSLLIGVPFNYLVPDERMLPPESIRAFALDPNWIAAVIDGAMSIGRTSSFDASHDNAVAPLVHAAVHARRGSVRARALGTDPPPPPQTGQITGFLMRSQLVADTPGLQVVAYDATDTALPILRLEQLSPNVLIGLFAGTAVRFEISEPAHTLRTGVASMSNPPSFSVTARDLGLTGLTGGGIGDPTTETAEVPFRVSDPRVIDIGALVTNLETALQNAGVFPAGSAIDAGALAIELLQAPARQDYTYTATASADAQAGMPTRVPLPDEVRAAGRDALDAYLRDGAR